MDCTTPKQVVAGSYPVVFIRIGYKRSAGSPPARRPADSHRRFYFSPVFNREQLGHKRLLISGPLSWRLYPASST